LADVARGPREEEAAAPQEETRSATANTSGSLCVMKTIAVPAAALFRMARVKASISEGARPPSAVQEQQLGIAGERARELEPLAAADRQLRGLGFRSPRDPRALLDRAHAEGETAPRDRAERPPSIDRHSDTVRPGGIAKC
jgi:hypothetical protein